MTIIFKGASLDACNLERWMQAAFDGPSRKIQYQEEHNRVSNKQLKGPWPGLDSPPSSVAVTSAVEIPAIEAILITRDGASAEAPLRSRGCTLDCSSATE